MGTTAKLDIKDGDFSASVREFLKAILLADDITAILAPQRLSTKTGMAHALITDPEKLGNVDPISPFFPVNSGKLAAKLTRKPCGGKIAALLRPCEIRAFIELVKLKQGDAENILIIGIDCTGAYKNRACFKARETDTEKLYKSFLQGSDESPDDNPATPCKSCINFVPEGCDLGLRLFGTDMKSRIFVQSDTEAGDNMIKKLGLVEAELPEALDEAVEKLLEKRSEFREKTFAETEKAVKSVEKTAAYFADCINCYNCRVACPVCYCKECIFATDVFDHEPSQYLQRAARNGSLKMPCDTVFYHMTRLAHMSAACVGCGQCSNACPNDIPVAELFMAAANRVQKAFEYEAGKNIDEPPPLSVFKEDELEDVVGI